MSWHWIKDEVIVAVHGEQIAEHGGISGLRDEGLLLSTLSRPRNLAAYRNPSVFDLAAAYAFGIIRNHPFFDGNKRTAFLAAYIFLDLNGWELIATEAEVVAAILSLAADEFDEAVFSDWLETRSIFRSALE